jgi:hypothetical protein
MLILKISATVSIERMKILVKQDKSPLQSKERMIVIL